jgi:hypothetical protein
MSRKKKESSRRNVAKEFRAHHRAMDVDENGDEWFACLAVWIDDELKLAYRTLKEMQGLMGIIKNAPDSIQFGMFRLYKSGRIRHSITSASNETDVGSLACRKDFESRARKAIAGLYDHVWPEIANLATQFLIRTVSDLQRLERDASAAIPSEDLIVYRFDSEEMSELLLRILGSEEREFLHQGRIRAKVGYYFPNGVTVVIPLDLPDYNNGKYRMAQAVTEAAQLAGATAIISISEGWVRNSDTEERTGDESLQVFVIRSDGTIANAATGIYRRDGAQLSVVSPIKLSDVRNEMAEQDLFPAWHATIATTCVREN